NVDADPGEAQVEHRIAQIPRTKVEFFPEPRRHVRNVSLTILAQIAAVIADHGSGVVIDALLLALVDRDDEGDTALARLLLHQADDGPVRHGFGDIVPAGLLFGAEVRNVKDLLQADNLSYGASSEDSGPRLFLQGEVLLFGRYAGFTGPHSPCRSRSRRNASSHAAQSEGRSVWTMFQCRSWLISS